jgi:hypothetical protein
LEELIESLERALPTDGATRSLDRLPSLADFSAAFHAFMQGKAKPLGPAPNRIPASSGGDGISGETSPAFGSPQGITGGDQKPPQESR